MLKLASLSLVALLALASPTLAKNTRVVDQSPKARCLAPAKFPDAVKVSGDDLTKFRKIAKGLPEQVDLVLLLKTAPVAVAFVNGCAVGYGVVGPVSAPAKPTDDGKI